MNTHILNLNPCSNVRQHDYLLMIKALLALDNYLFKTESSIFLEDDIQEVVEKFINAKSSDLEFMILNDLDMEIIEKATEFLPQDDIHYIWKEALENASTKQVQAA